MVAHPRLFGSGGSTRTIFLGLCLDQFDPQRQRQCSMIPRLTPWVQSPAHAAAALPRALFAEALSSGDLFEETAVQGALFWVNAAAAAALEQGRSSRGSGLSA